MVPGYVFCKQCEHFNDWRRYFAISTPVLGLLVALVSVVGVNATNVISFFNPDRAAFLVGARFVSETQLLVVATNTGGATGFVDELMSCSAQTEGGNFLSFRALAATAVPPGTQVSITYEPNSAFYTRFLIALKDGEFEPTEAEDGYGFRSLSQDLGGPWKCGLLAYDKFGLVSAAIQENLLEIWMRNNQVGGNFSIE